MAFRRGARLAAAHATVLVADSNAVADMWARDLGVRPSYVAYGADVVHDRTDERVRALGLEPGSYLLVVARLAPENNVDLFLDAVEKLPVRPPVVVVGDANYRCATARRLQRLSREKEVLWLGHVADQTLLGELWSNCRLYVHGHSAGGTNPALLQALGFGAPTIALDTPFNKEVLDALPASLYPLDSAGLCEILARELSEPGSHATAAAHGRSLVEQSYAWEDVCARYERLLVEAAESSVSSVRVRTVPAVEAS
jgi:glycosyltransferase involved in cell wall biosynthesis